LQLAGKPACELQKEFHMIDHDDTIVTATLVPDSERLDFVPRHFGWQSMRVGQHLFSRLSTLSCDYRGGFWQFWDLSNGGCYLAPTKPAHFRLIVDGNGFDGTLSADATGVVASLFTLGELSFSFPEVELYATRFHQLRDFAADHLERRSIFRAID
jgi:hypothetical protein